MNTTEIIVYGFPELVEPTTIGNIMLADSIHAQTNWTINYDAIKYIPGCVWDHQKKQFQPGRSAYISVPDVVTAAGIKIINAATVKSSDMYPLTYELSPSINDNASSTGKDSHNTYYTYGHQNYEMRLSARTTCTSTTYIIPQHRQNCIAPQSTSNIAPFTQSIKQPHTDPPKDPSGDPNAASLPLQTIPNGNTNVDNADAKNNIKCDILLTFKTASNIYCANNDEQNATLTTNPLTTPYTHRFKVPITASRTPQTTILVPTKWNEQIHITKNNSQKHGYAIMRALTHYKSSLYLMFGVVLSILLSLPSISASLTSTGYVLNVENSNGSLILMKDINVINSQYIDNANDLSLIILKL